MDKPRKTPLRDSLLDILLSHFLVTLWALKMRRGHTGFDLRLDPSFQAALARVDQVLAREGRIAIGKLRGDAGG